MPHQVTVTGKTGPNFSLAGLVIPNVVEVSFVPDPKLLRVRTSEVNGNVKDFDISAATTVTCTITTGNFAFVVS